MRLVFAARHDQSHMAYSPQYAPEYTGGLGRSAQTCPHSGGALLHGAQPSYPAYEFGSVGPNPSSQGGATSI